MYDPIVCQRASARGREATGHELLELAALGVVVGQRYSGPVCLYWLYALVRISGHGGQRFSLKADTISS